MQCLDAARDNVELKTRLLTNGSNLASRYLACRDNLYIDAHARKLLIEIKMKSGADHTSYCVVTHEAFSQSKEYSCILRPECIGPRGTSDILPSHFLHRRETL